MDESPIILKSFREQIDKVVLREPQLIHFADILFFTIIHFIFYCLMSFVIFVGFAWGYNSTSI